MGMPYNGTHTHIHTQAVACVRSDFPFAEIFIFTFHIFGISINANGINFISARLRIPQPNGISVYEC